MPTETEEKVKTRPATFDRLKKKKPVTKTLRVYLEDFPEPDMSQFWPPRSTPTEAQKQAYEQARTAWQRQMESESVLITLRGVGRRLYGEIMDACPATEDQRKLAKERQIAPPEYNPLTFAPALIQASLVEPELTSEQVHELFDSWNQGEMTRLFLAALEVNTGSKVEDFGNASGMMHF